MVNYQNGKIYKIESFEGKCQYIGSTCQKLCQRMAKHKNSYRNPQGTNTSRQVLKYKDAKIYLIENCPCNSKEELHRKEGEYIRKLDCVNKIVPYRTRQEYYNDNKDKIIEKIKHYINNNKEKVKKGKKKWKDNNKEKLKEKYTCECGSTFRKTDKSRHYKSKKHITYINNNGVQKLPQEKKYI